MNNVIMSMLPTSITPKAQQSTSAPSDVFQSIFQQVSSKTGDQVIKDQAGSETMLLDSQDQQDMQVILEALFDKVPSDGSLGLEEQDQPEDAWELLEQVLGEDQLAAYLPTQLKEMAENVLQNIKPTDKNSAVSDLLAQLEQLQEQLTNGSFPAATGLVSNSAKEIASLQIMTSSNFSMSLTNKKETQVTQTAADNTSVQKAANNSVVSDTLSADRRDTLSALSNRLATGSSLQEAQTARNQTALMQQPETKRTETANAVRQLVDAAAKGGEEKIPTSSAATQQRDSQLVDQKQVSMFQVPKQEQLVFHLKQADQMPEQASEELIQKLEQAVKFSGILSDRNGLKELSIQLKPGNLGDLQVKLVRENGNITVQILATSKQAKDLLESNISSLKHMFSPHQVTISERADQIQTASPERNDQQMFQENDEEQPDRQQRQQDNVMLEDNESTFADILLEQKEIKI
ncbi:flagellar hook-length control protein FliK [Terribacillus saccharophilus]|uniref:Flagellar hook-length control protein FliK n=1 Tax=Terribacillus saccharophilus TaxID=361277 RepID=A0AAX2ECN3_9BACI|nr:flagellar hook-length control protein FliK [Terribacillus saccharophilus]SEM73131.1 flagellar hook-length control protein FliK [Terribacillus saccharophilus]